MKKVLILTFVLAFLLSLSSCGSPPNKKVIPEDTPSTVQESTTKPSPTQSSSAGPENSGSQPVQTGSNVTNPGPLDTSGLSNEKISQWMPGINKVHKVPQLNQKFQTLLDKYGGYFVGDTSSQVIYLTFDEGYENGYTGRILDILKANDVKAAFFVTKPYIKSEPDLVRRMVNEGHIVGNHTNTHPSMPDISDDKVIKEITDTSDYFKEVTNVDMPNYLRPPMGEWSERTLYLTNSLGYKTILWSMAYKDWVTDDQPGRDASYKFVDTYYHNGAILLLHAVSKSNTEALPDIIKNLKDKGYRFAQLSELQ